MVKVFFDTNVIIDAFTDRDYDYRDSQRLVAKAINGDIKGYISSKQVTDIYYILRKYVQSETVKRQIIRDILDTFTVLPFLSSDAYISLNSELPDYEDAVLEELVKLHCVPFIVTHNVEHFKNSKTFVFTPKKFIAYIDSKSFN